MKNIGILEIHYFFNSFHLKKMYVVQQSPHKDYTTDWKRPFLYMCSVFSISLVCLLIIIAAILLFCCACVYILYFMYFRGEIYILLPRTYNNVTLEDKDHPGNNLYDTMFNINGIHYTFGLLYLPIMHINTVGNYTQLVVGNNYDIVYTGIFFPTLQRTGYLKSICDA